MKPGGSCCECSCGWMGNKSICPQCGNRTLWDENEDIEDKHDFYNENPEKEENE